MMTPEIIKFFRMKPKTFHNNKFQYSGPRTPEQSSKVQRKLPIFYGRIRPALTCTELKEFAMNF
jgi:hypothetical protein